MSEQVEGTMFATSLVGRVSWQCNECLRLNAEATTSGHGLNVHSLHCAGCGVEVRVRVEVREEARVNYERLVLELSELLNRAIATHGELSSEEWQRMEIAQRQAYAVKHPEVREDGEHLEDGDA